MDVIADLAYPLPVLVICALLGVPAADRHRFAAVVGGAGREPGRVEHPRLTDVVRRGNAAVAGLTVLSRPRAASPMQQPGDDLLSDLIAARDGADRLTEDELIATCILLFFAGHETTVNLIGNGVLALLRHPRELQRLLDEPSPD